MIVEIVKATLEEAMKVVTEAVEKGYKFVTSNEIAGLYYVKLDASDVVKTAEVETPVVAQEPQEAVETVETVAQEAQQAVEVEVTKPSTKRGKK